MSFLPLANRIALRRITAETPSHFIIPEDAQELSTECEVVAVPAEPYLTDFGQVLHCPVAVGDRVLVGKYTPHGHKVPGKDGVMEEVLYLRWEELLAVERPGGVTDPPAETDTEYALELPLESAILSTTPFDNQRGQMIESKEIR